MLDFLFSLPVGLILVVGCFFYAVKKEWETNPEFRYLIQSKFKPGSVPSFTCSNKALLNKKNLADKFGPVVLRKPVVLHFYGTPGGGKSSVVNLMESPFRIEEGSGPTHLVGDFIGHATCLASESGLYLNDRVDFTDLLLPRNVDFSGLSKALLEDETDFKQLVKIILKSIKGEEALSKTDYSFLLQMDSQPEAVRTTYEELCEQPPKVSKCTVAVFVFPVDEAPSQQLLQVAQGCRNARVPVVIICTKADKLPNQIFQNKAALLEKFGAYTNTVHVIDARPGKTSERQIREIWFSIFTACFTIPLAPQ